MSNKKANRVPTEQQKFRIYKNITEPALLAKNKPEEVSDIVKAIKEALGIKPLPVGNTTRIKEVFGNEDVALQQKIQREERNIRIKTRKEMNDKKKKQAERDKASSVLTNALNQSLSVKKDNANVKLYDPKTGKYKHTTTSHKLVDKLGKTKPLLDEYDKRIGIDPQSYFSGAPSNEEKAMRKAINKRREALLSANSASTFSVSASP